MISDLNVLSIRTFWNIQIALPMPGLTAFLTRVQVFEIIVVGPSLRPKVGEQAN
jgi:hypothetical protein